MRFGFRERPYDLLLAGVLSLLFLPFLIVGSSALRFAFGIMIIFFLPGYALVGVIFPGDREVRWLERLALSVGLSIAAVALVGVVLNLTPWGVRLESIVVALVTLNLGVCGVAYRRRMGLSPEKRLGLELTVLAPRWRELGTQDRILALGLAASLMLGALALALVGSAPLPQETFTEFYLLDSDGGVTGYPTEIRANDSAAVILGIGNHESRTVSYTIEVKLVAVRYVRNQTTGFNDTVDLSNTTLDTIPVSLASAERSESRYAFQITSQGDFQLRFLLFIGAPQGLPYRVVRLSVHVT